MRWIMSCINCFFYILCSSGELTWYIRWGSGNTDNFGLSFWVSFPPHHFSQIRGTKREWSSISVQQCSKYVYSHIYLSVKWKSYNLSRTQTEHSVLRMKFGVSRQTSIYYEEHKGKHLDQFGYRIQRQKLNGTYSETLKVPGNYFQVQYLDVKASLQPCFVDKIVLWYSPANFTNIFMLIFGWQALFGGRSP